MAEELLEAILRLRDLGHKYSKDGDSEDAVEHCIDFEDIQLTLMILSGHFTFYIRKRLSEHLKVNYHAEKTTLCGFKFVAHDIVSVGENRIRFSISRWGTDFIKSGNQFKNLKEISKDEWESDLDEDNNPLLLLYKYTTEECILNYFSKNEFIKTFDETHQCQFVDLPLEAI